MDSAASVSSPVEALGHDESASLASGSAAGSNGNGVTDRPERIADPAESGSETARTDSDAPSGAADGAAGASPALADATEQTDRADQTDLSARGASLRGRLAGAFAAIQGRQGSAATLATVQQKLAAVTREREGLQAQLDAEVTARGELVQEMAELEARMESVEVAARELLADEVGVAVENLPVTADGPSAPVSEEAAWEAMDEEELAKERQRLGKEDPLAANRLWKWNRKRRG